MSFKKMYWSPVEEHHEQRSKQAEEYIWKLGKEVQSGRSTGFNRTLFKYIQDNPHVTIRDAWEAVENSEATKNRVRSRTYPFNFDN